MFWSRSDFAAALPVALVVLWATATLLQTLGDERGAVAVQRIVTIAAAGWLVDLILLVVTLGVRSVLDDEQRGDEP